MERRGLIPICPSRSSNQQEEANLLLTPASYLASSHMESRGLIPIPPSRSSNQQEEANLLLKPAFYLASSHMESRGLIPTPPATSNKECSPGKTPTIFLNITHFFPKCVQRLLPWARILEPVNDIFEVRTQIARLRTVPYEYNKEEFVRVCKIKWDFLMKDPWWIYIVYLASRNF